MGEQFFGSVGKNMPQHSREKVLSQRQRFDCSKVNCSKVKRGGAAQRGCKEAIRNK